MHDLPDPMTPLKDCRSECYELFLLHHTQQYIGLAVSCFDLTGADGYSWPQGVFFFDVIALLSRRIDIFSASTPDSRQMLNQPLPIIPIEPLEAISTDVSYALDGHTWVLI